MSELEYPELFKGKGGINGEIQVKLCEDAVPHTEPV